MPLSELSLKHRLLVKTYRWRDGNDTVDFSAEAAVNVAFPLDRLHELAGEGTIGEVAPRHVSLMGSITAPGRLVAKSAPEIVEILRDDAVDVALLVPV